ncbi:hypothetical protein EVA_20470 [gut metagenome]|uniref:Uncharacterized protein n=1 Tax=gut metagenome TaxID=749906 RepID=J9FAF9_9ZZZZ
MLLVIVVFRLRTRKVMHSLEKTKMSEQLGRKKKSSANLKFSLLL